MVLETARDFRERCPYQTGTPVAYDFERDKVYEGAVMCSLVDKRKAVSTGNLCVLEYGLECETYEEYLKETENE